ncbi:TPA: hypothetical protein ACH3X1_008238 [Trebouxia sp. C0004]
MLVSGRHQLVLLAFGVLAGSFLTFAESYVSHPVEGKLRLPVFADKSIRSSKIKLVLSVNGGSQLQAFPTIDGSFLFPSVPAGTHMLDVVSVDLLFPQVRVKHAVYIFSIQAEEHADPVGTHRCRWQYR